MPFSHTKPDFVKMIDDMSPSSTTNCNECGYEKENGHGLTCSQYVEPKNPCAETPSECKDGYEHPTLIPNQEAK